jgi:hypothetical protein
MELKYVKAMEENGLKLSDLPQDAQTGIAEIAKVLKGFRLLESRGRKPTQVAMRKLSAMDKWVYYEILDYLHDTDKNDDDMPVDADDVLDGLKPDDKTSDEPKPDALGLQIEAELDAMYATSKREFTIDEIKKSAPKAYREIWDSYEPGDENGIITSKYSFVENDNELFILKLK